jgi:hypothetical protein
MIVSMTVCKFSALLAFTERNIQIKFVAVVIYTPIFFFPGALVGLLGAWIGQIYISGQLPVKRFMSNTRAPVLAQYVSRPSLILSSDSFGKVSARLLLDWVRNITFF